MYREKKSLYIQRFYIEKYSSYKILFKHANDERKYNEKVHSIH